MTKVVERPLCALTGANGYVGRRLEAYLRANGWDVLQLTRNPRPGSNARAFRLGDVVAPEHLGNVQCLIHGAYDFRPRTREEIHSVNVDGTSRLLDAAVAAGVPRIVCISTISAFDGARSLYGQAKLDIERDALSRAAFVVRPGLVFSDTPGGMFGSLVESVRSARVVPLIGDGSQAQYLVHSDDLAQLVLDYASGTFAGSVVPLTAANSQPWPLRAILRAMAHRLGREVRFLPIPWRLVWSGLRTAEIVGVPLGFRSDSVISLVFQNPTPDFSQTEASGYTFRPFDVNALALSGNAPASR